MLLNNEQTERLQKKELEILKVFVCICEQLNLRYYLMGGTMLGAVRHGGFIPWDDDIDVGMPRSDYEVFLDKSAELLPSWLFLQNCRTENEYPMNFSKIRDKNSTFIETSIHKLRINHGIYIDVFPLDYCYDNKLQSLLFTFANRVLLSRISSVYTLPEELKNNELKQWQKIKHTIINHALAGIWPDVYMAVKKREKLLSLCKKGRFMANYCGAWGEKEIVPVEWYGDGKKMRFEDLDVTVPIEYKKWLTQVYGDYMQMPPIEKRKAHHYAEMIDLDKPYSEYCR